MEEEGEIVEETNVVPKPAAPAISPGRFSSLSSSYPAREAEFMIRMSSLTSIPSTIAPIAPIASISASSNNKIQVRADAPKRSLSDILGLDRPSILPAAKINVSSDVVVSEGLVKSGPPSGLVTTVARDTKRARVEWGKGLQRLQSNASVDSLEPIVDNKDTLPTDIAIVLSEDMKHQDNELVDSTQQFQYLESASTSQPLETKSNEKDMIVDNVVLPVDEPLSETTDNNERDVTMSNEIVENEAISMTSNEVSKEKIAVVETAKSVSVEKPPKQEKAKKSSAKSEAALVNSEELRKSAEIVQKIIEELQKVKANEVLVNTSTDIKVNAPRGLPLSGRGSRGGRVSTFRRVQPPSDKAAKRSLNKTNATLASGGSVPTSLLLPNSQSIPASALIYHLQKAGSKVPLGNIFYTKSELILAFHIIRNIVELQSYALSHDAAAPKAMVIDQTLATSTPKYQVPLSHLHHEQFSRLLMNDIYPVPSIQNIMRLPIPTKYEICYNLDIIEKSNEILFDHLLDLKRKQFFIESFYMKKHRMLPKIEGSNKEADTSILGVLVAKPSHQRVISKIYEENQLRIAESHLLFYSQKKRTHKPVKTKESAHVPVPSQLLTSLHDRIEKVSTSASTAAVSLNASWEDRRKEMQLKRKHMVKAIRHRKLSKICAWKDLGDKYLELQHAHSLSLYGPGGIIEDEQELPVTIPPTPMSMFLSSLSFDERLQHTTASVPDMLSPWLHSYVNPLLRERDSSNNGKKKDGKPIISSMYQQPPFIEISPMIDCCSNRLTTDGRKQTCMNFEASQLCPGNCNCMKTLDNQLRLSRPWTDIEKAIFVDKFLQFPKNFYKISKFLTNRSVKDCVKFYYDSKTEIPFKKLLKEIDNRKKKLKVAWSVTVLASNEVNSCIFPLQIPENSSDLRDEREAAVQLPGDLSFCTATFHPPSQAKSEVRVEPRELVVRGLESKFSRVKDILAQRIESMETTGAREVLSSRAWEELEDLKSEMNELLSFTNALSTENEKGYFANPNAEVAKEEKPTTTESPVPSPRLKTIKNMLRDHPIPHTSVSSKTKSSKQLQPHIASVKDGYIPQDISLFKLIPTYKPSSSSKALLKSSSSIAPILKKTSSSSLPSTVLIPGSSEQVKKAQNISQAQQMVAALRAKQQLSNSSSSNSFVSNRAPIAKGVSNGPNNSSSKSKRPIEITESMDSQVIEDPPIKKQTMEFDSKDPKF